MKLLNPKKFIGRHPDKNTNELMKKVISWFESKGLPEIKKDYHEKNWNYDFVEFMKDEGIFSTLMTPEGYGDEAASWNTFQNVDFAEIVSFYGITYWYTFQVSMLGLGPIFNGSNEAVKHKAAKLLKEGGVFAFGLSEKEHGADIYSSSMRLIPQQNGTYLARGHKYYIGNGNEAALISTFGKIEGTDEYVFFVVESNHPQYECIQNVVNQSNYVAEYSLNDYPITNDDILSRGKPAWDDMLNTINMCKFNLGFGAIGLSTHAFYEAINHAANRKLFGKYVTDFSHIKRFFVDAYCRLIAMKLFSGRATDYMRSASLTDRRYLLYNPMVKMKVTIQGEEVIRILWDIIAAKGFEKDPFFETAADEIRMLPKLEGTAHVNMAIIVKFLKNYFFNPKEYPVIKKIDDRRNDSFLFEQGPTGGLADIQFHDYNIAYDSVNLKNVTIFKTQLALFKEMLSNAGPDEKQLKDIDYLLAVGEIFTLIAYGQLILENKKIEGIEDDLIEEIFDFMIRDFSKYALALHDKVSNTEQQKKMALQMIKSPIYNSERFERIWNEEVLNLEGQY